MGIDTLFGTKKDKKMSSGKYFNSNSEANFFKKTNERVFYDPHIRKYYIKRV